MVFVISVLSDFEFFPSEEQKRTSNIFQFMTHLHISSLEELSQKASQNLEWFWEQVDKDIGIVWDKPYEKTLDMTNRASCLVSV